METQTARLNLQISQLLFRPGAVESFPTEGEPCCSVGVSAGESRRSSSFERLVEAPGSQQGKESISGSAGAELVVRGDGPGKRVLQQLPVGREPSRRRKGSLPLQRSRNRVLSTCGGQSSSVSSSPQPGKDTFSLYKSTQFELCSRTLSSRASCPSCTASGGSLPLPCSAQHSRDTPAAHTRDFPAPRAPSRWQFKKAHLSDPTDS